MWRPSRSGHSFFPRGLHVAHQDGIGGKLPQGVDDLTAERAEIVVRRIDLRGLEMPREQVRHLGRVRLGLFFLRTGQAVNEPIRIPMFEVSEAISLNMWKAFPPSISFRVSNDLLDTALYLYLVSNGSMRGIDRADNGSLRERSVWFDRGPQDLLNVDPSTTVPRLRQIYSRLPRRQTPLPKFRADSICTRGGTSLDASHEWNAH
ncbi:MAG: hypothetical protein BRD39_01030 [Bacteroidetes bacterium QH_9_64_21]|nr:MAG: hypothetical protein BRD39_01030 [Bacteroidetes bacterium QH_9_64_21]